MRKEGEESMRMADNWSEYPLQSKETNQTCIRDVIQYGQNFLKCFEISLKQHAFLFYSMCSAEFPENKKFPEKSHF